MSCRKGLAAGLMERLRRKGRFRVKSLLPSDNVLVEWKCPCGHINRERRCKVIGRDWEASCEFCGKEVEIVSKYESI